MNTSRDSLTDLLDLLGRLTTRFRAVKNAFFLGQAILLVSLIPILMGLTRPEGATSPRWRWLVILYSLAGAVVSYLPGTTIQKIRTTLELIRGTGTAMGEDEEDLERRINTVGRRDARGGTLNPPLLGMICLVLLILWSMIGIAALFHWDKVLPALVAAGGVMGLIALAYDKVFGKNLRVP